MRFTKPFITLITALFVLFFAAPSFANGDYPHDEATGSGHISATAGDIASSFGLTTLPTGLAGGFGLSGGYAHAGADGDFSNGSLLLNGASIGGGITTTQVVKIPGELVGSMTNNFSRAGASLDLTVDPGEGQDSYGIASGGICGITGQGSINNSTLKLGSNFISDGKTCGVAAQGSIGGFSGHAFVTSGPDGTGWCEGIDSNATANLYADIQMTGLSSTQSSKNIQVDGGNRFETLGTGFQASTTVLAVGNAHEDSNGWAGSGAHLCGGYIVGGGAKATTVQTVPGGMATAHASGLYTGIGGLNTQYNGSVIGGSQTSSQTVSGMNGSIMSSAARVTVTSTIGPASVQ